MEPRRQPISTTDDSDDIASAVTRPKPDEEDEEAHPMDSIGRSKRDFSSGRRMTKHVDDELIMVRRPDGSHGLMARDDPKGFMFTKFDTARKVKKCWNRTAGENQRKG